MHKPICLLDKLAETHTLSLLEYEQLIAAFSPEAADHARVLADGIRREIYGNQVFIRGLIEVGNCCKNNCYYCGIRRGNTACERYRLTKDEVLACCDEGYLLGFRTFVLQGGEDPAMTGEKAAELVAAIKKRHKDCAVTLSLGEYAGSDYAKMRAAGADRYLLRHETADKAHYETLHPAEMSFDNRMRCLGDLKKLGFTTGCGFMVGSPHQSVKTLAEDLKFIEDFSPEMCGIGPFIPHKDTPFSGEKTGSAELTCYFLSILRIMHPHILLPATTALGTVKEDGRIKGILAGANVVMPNLSPMSARVKYMLYDRKNITGCESAEGLRLLREQMQSIGFEVVVSRGDPA